MALPSFAPENVKAVSPSALARIFARVKSALAERNDSRLTQFVAGKVFLVRIGSALLALVSQVLLARWMGSFEFGIYIYVWTWVLMIGALSDVGLSSAARRFIPEYTSSKTSTGCAAFSADRGGWPSAWRRPSVLLAHSV